MGVRNVRVHVDDARGDIEPPEIDRLVAGLFRQATRHGSNLAIADANIDNTIDPVCRIDDVRIP